MCIFSVISQVNSWLGKIYIYKKKVSDVSHSIQNVKKKMQFQTQVYGDYRFIHQKGEEKLGSEKWIICM